ncbi:hypothetical protein PCASD_23245 [Puccinia coronata f. sp. avenae]|uniref:Uncharacterized protein n=1 Tax=Puccinia coronata f. sp. avenae TaxID=200324 RepID=A0A2N5TRP7_9BASI|nr:hypothetical protein PCASD_23245 [Puccinia coronata f. sp. avenae]
MKMLVNFPKLFVPLLGEISSFAIKQSLDQFNRLQKLDPTETFSSTLTKGVGIPCAHKIAEILEDGNLLSPNNFHPQWQLNYNPEVTNIAEPETNLDDEIKRLLLTLSHKTPLRLATLFKRIHQIAAGTHLAVAIQAPQVKKNTKGRPSLKNNASKSNRRDCSDFEVVEAEIKKKSIAKKREAPGSGKPIQKSKRMKKTIDTFEESEFEEVNEDTDSSLESDISLLEKKENTISKAEENGDNMPLGSKAQVDVKPVLEQTTHPGPTVPPPQPQRNPTQTPPPTAIPANSPRHPEHASAVMEIEARHWTHADTPRTTLAEGLGGNVRIIVKPLSSGLSVRPNPHQYCNVDAWVCFSGPGTLTFFSQVVQSGPARKIATTVAPTSYLRHPASSAWSQGMPRHIAGLKTAGMLVQTWQSELLMPFLRHDTPSYQTPGPMAKYHTSLVCLFIA